MVAFLTSFLLTFVLLLPIVYVGKRRAPGDPFTWGESLLTATYIFFLFWWAYAIVPHLWLTYADAELGWRADAIVWGPGNILRPQSAGGWFPMTITYQVVRDIIVVLIYVVFLAVPMAGWAMWQGRADQSDKPEIETTAFGRPLAKKGA